MALDPDERKDRHKVHKAVQEGWWRGVERPVGSADQLVPKAAECVSKKKQIKIEIIQNGEERFLAKTFSDGSKELFLIVKQPPKKRPPGRYRYTDMNKGRKKRF